MSWEKFSKTEKCAELGHDMETDRINPELPGKDLGVVPQTDETVTLQDMDNPDAYIIADTMEIVEERS